MEETQKESMNERELRIGNLILYKGRQLTVAANTFGDMIRDRLKGINDYSGIAITPEWLERSVFRYCGDSPFKHHPMKYWANNRIILFTNGSPPENAFLIGVGEQLFGEYQFGTGRWIYFVHEVQNFYHSVHGKDIEIKSLVEGEN